MDQVITLLKVGVEGGDVSLVLAMTDAGIFSYRLATTSSFNGFLSEEDRIGEDGYTLHSSQPIVIDWAGALELLDEFSPDWMKMYPLLVHPSISIRIERLLKERYQQLGVHGFENWICCIKRGCCGE